MNKYYTALVDAARLIHDRKIAEKQVEDLQARCSAQLDYIRNLQSGIDTRDAEIARLRAEVERLTSDCDTHNQRLVEIYDRARKAENGRDALQARFDAGVRVYSLDCKDWHTEVCLSDNHSATLIIDQPDAAIVDERTGKADRREKNLFGAHGRPGKSDRRRVAGTRADRAAVQAREASE